MVRYRAVRLRPQKQHNLHDEVSTIALKYAVMHSTAVSKLIKWAKLITNSAKFEIKQGDTVIA